MQGTTYANALRAIDKDFALLGLNVLPDFLAPKGSAGRRRLFKAMGDYYAAGGHKTASPLVRARYAVNRKYGVSQTDIEHFDLSVCYGLLVNTVPGTSWGALLHLLGLCPPVHCNVRISNQSCSVAIKRRKRPRELPPLISLR